MAELRQLKRRAAIAEETVRIKKERLDEAEQEYEEEHQTFTICSKRLEEKWEQRFDMLARMARDAGVRSEDIEAVRLQPLQSGTCLRRARVNFQPFCKDPNSGFANCFGNNFCRVLHCRAAQMLFVSLGVVSFNAMPTALPMP